MTDELEKLPPDDSTEILPKAGNGRETVPDSVVEIPAVHHSAEEIPAVIADAPADEMPVFEDDIRATNELDIDAALAAVASLHDLARDEPGEDLDVPEEHDSFEDSVVEHIKTDVSLQASLITEQYDAVNVTVPAEEAPITTGDFFRPPPLVLQRGQAASVIPAVLLMAAGGWLTYLLMTGAALPAGSLIGLAMCGVGVMLLAQWFTAGRWTRGSFFMGSLLTLVGGVLIVLFQPGSMGLAGFPGVLIAAGAAFVLTALLTKPRSGPVLLVGLALLAAGIVTVPVLMGTIDAALLNIAATIAPVILIIVAIILVLPLLRRRR